MCALARNDMDFIPWKGENMKIAIIGYSGSGKSTLARKLGEIYDVPVLHFDAVQFLPGWEVRPQDEKEAITKAFLDSHAGWVIDGNYSRLSYERRMEEADVIIILLFNRWNCLYRVTRRYLRYKDSTRPDMGEGCREKLDWEFVKWVLRDGRSKTARQRHLNVVSQYPEKTIVLKNQRQLDDVQNHIHRVLKK